MPSLNLDLNWDTHPKTVRLVSLLGPAAGFSLIRLWLHCARHHSDDGSLTEYSTQEIEYHAGWTGKPGKFVAALASDKIRFLERTAEGFAIHDWPEHNGHLLKYKERAKAAAAARWGAKSSDATSNASSIAKRPPEQCPPNAVQPPAVQPPAVPAVQSPPNPPTGQEGGFQDRADVGLGRPEGNGNGGAGGNTRPWSLPKDSRGRWSQQAFLIGPVMWRRYTGGKAGCCTVMDVLDKALKLMSPELVLERIRTRKKTDSHPEDWFT